MQSTTRWLIVSILGILLVFGIFVTFLWALGMFSFAGSEASAKVVGSALALVGAFFTSLLTGVGIFLRLAYEQRNAVLQEQAQERLRLEFERDAALKQQAEERLRLEAERNARRSREEQERLRMETAIKAVGLMSTASGADASPSVKASALILLANLGQLEFALIQLSAMWAREAIPPAGAVWLIDQGLRSRGPDENLQNLAAGILISNHDKLFVSDAGSFEFPETWQLRWDTSLTEYARRVGLEVHMLLLLAKRPWRSWQATYLNQVFVMFYLIMMAEGADRERGESRLESGAALAAKLLLKVVGTVGEGLYTPEGPRSWSYLRSDIEAVLSRFGGEEGARTASTVKVHQLLGQLRSWVDDDSEPDTAAAAEASS